MLDVFEMQYLNILKRRAVKLNGYEFNVSVASSKYDLMTGLMHVENLEDNEGMLFLFNENKIQNFWMKNTLIPLDVIFFDENFNAINYASMNVEKQKSFNESEYEYEKRLPLYYSDGPCFAALEVNKGIADILRIKKGDHLNIF